MNIIEDIIYPVLDQLKEEDELEFENRVDLELYGDGDTILDSLSLVDFLVEIRDKVSEVTGKDIILATPKALSIKDGPFKTVSSLRDYINQLIENA